MARKPVLIRPATLATDRDIDKPTDNRPLDARLRNMGWEIYSRPTRGPVLWQHKLLEIVRTEAEAGEWCDRELKRVET